tara:strand:+ start:3237 stop:3875 length:639 start_codon:yes stop_codon:yes gene_type:complete
MHLVMFDIDGTLVDTSLFEDDCFTQAVTSWIDLEIDRDWTSFSHVSDTGIINELIAQVGTDSDRKLTFQRIRTEFTGRVRAYLSTNSISEIAGASQLIAHLKRRKDVVLAIATGGWRETSELKLDSAGINYADIPFASSDDHFDRSEIMRLAEQRCGDHLFESRTYIGDGPWDKAASMALGFNFILVGNKTTHHQAVGNLTNIRVIESFIGL